jgi:methylmalonyl-CoA mutase
LPRQKADEGAEVKPLRILRGAEEFEKLRLASDKAAKRPSVFILATGQPGYETCKGTVLIEFFRMRRIPYN